MDFIATKSFFYTTKEAGPQQRAEKGKTFSVDVSNQENRQMVFDCLQNGQCYPANYPEIIEILITRSFGIQFSAGLGFYHGAAGETRDVPREIALHLVTRGYARPTSSVLWSPEINPESFEDFKIRKLHEEETAIEAAAMRQEDKAKRSFVQRWRSR